MRSLTSNRFVPEIINSAARPRWWGWLALLWLLQAGEIWAQAPATLSGQTVNLTITGETVPYAIEFGAGTFTLRANGNFVQSGTYTYSTPSSTQGRAVLTTTTPPDDAGDVDTITLTFANATSGTFVDNYVWNDATVGSYSGTFTTTGGAVARPTIGTQPRSQSVVAGGNVTLSVSATGSGTLTYQWFKDGVAVSGATAASLTLNSLTTAQAGQYHVEVSNAGGMTPSMGVYVVALPVGGGTFPGSDNFNDNSRDTARWGTTDFGPAGALVEANGRLEFRNSTPNQLNVGWVPQNGTAPYAQDWEARVRVNLPALSFPADGFAVVGLAVVNSADPGDRVTVELDAGRELGGAYRQFLSAIYTNDVDVPNLDLTASTASTSATLRARWVAATARLHLEYDADGPANGEAWTLLRTFDPAATWGMSSGSFLIAIGGDSENRVITSGDGLWLDDFAASTAPVITAQPRSQSVVAGGNVTLSVSATGSGPLMYQWFRDGVAVNGATAASLTLTSLTPTQAGAYHVEVSDAGGMTISDGVLVFVLPAAGGTFSGGDSFTDNSRNTALWGTANFGPASALVEANGRLEFHTSTPNGIGIWAWQSGTAPYAQDWEARVRVNLPALSFTGDGYAVLALVVANSADPGDLVTVELETGYESNSLYRRFLSATHVDDVDVPNLDLPASTVSTSATLRARWVASTARLHLEYDADGPANGEVWTLLRTFDPAATWGMSGGSFMILIGGESENRVITSGDGLWLDDFAASTAPVITAQPQNQVATATSNVTFSVTATGSGLTYQWRKNGTPILGETAASLTLNNVTRAAGGTYSVVVTSGGIATPSSAALLRVIVPQQLQTPQRGGGGQFQLRFADPDSGVGGDLSRFEVHHTTNFIGAGTVWVTNSGTFTLSNGKILFDDTGSVGAPRRFYRVIEK
jgi:hypothetical protein